jgi:protein-S-isoprenylcysteine O-methyltransferase Ste14
MADWPRVARRIRVPLGFLFAAVYVWLARPTRLSLLAGALIALPGLVLRAFASGHVRKNEELAMTGPYAYTRNPLYLGSLIMAVGFGVAARNIWIVLLVVIFFLAIYLPVIRSEEDYLRRTFPEFEEYCRRVPRWMRLWPESGPKAAFSWVLYNQHREYNAALGMAGILLLLVIKMHFLR